MIERPNVWVLSAPSGTGKSTLIRKILATLPELELCISTTTRPRRPNERDGVHYHFVDDAQFRADIAAGRMIEWAEVFGNLYGTSQAAVEQITQRSKVCLLEIDVQGFQQIRRVMPHVRSIFLYPPSPAQLWQRLRERGTDDLEVCRRRIGAARCELAAAATYDYRVLNDNLDQALASFLACWRSPPGSRAGDADPHLATIAQMLASWDTTCFDELAHTSS